MTVPERDSDPQSGRMPDEAQRTATEAGPDARIEDPFSTRVKMPPMAHPVGTGMRPLPAAFNEVLSRLARTAEARRVQGNGQGC